MGMITACVDAPEPADQSNIQIDRDSQVLPYNNSISQSLSTDNSIQSRSVEIEELTLCSSKYAKCSIISYNINIHECVHLNRMLLALKYYHMLNLHTTPSNNDKFIHFYQNVYVELLNDYQHIISTHSQQLEPIHDHLVNNEQFGGACDHSKCKSFQRYYEDSREITTATNMEYKLSFFCELLDSMHHWLYHIFDSGMRIKTSIITTATDYKEEKVRDNAYIDTAFSRIKNEIWARRDKLEVNTNRYDQESNKYTLNVNATKHNNVNEKRRKGITFTDILFHRLKRSGLPLSTINDIKWFLMNEDYDTDSIMNDTIDSHYLQQHSNILKSVKDDQKCTLFITEFIQEMSSMSLNKYLFRQFIHNT